MNTASHSHLADAAAAQQPSKGELHVVQLYPRDMNIYGDTGNAQVLVQRLKWHAYTPVLHSYNQGDAWPNQVDIVVGGGGQDACQERIVEDLAARGELLRSLAEDGTPMLVICGLYQLFGKRFVTSAGPNLPGIGIFDHETVATSQRLIGNVVLTSSEFGQVVGYENHSGQTTLGPSATPLGKVTLGAGNNADSGAEGCRVHNVIGSYLHGSLLPKNPRIADFLITAAATKRFGAFTPGDIDDSLAAEASRIAATRPR